MEGLPGSAREAVMTHVRFADGSGLLPRSGEVLLLEREASVQFAGASAIRLRVIHVDDRPTYPGWCWLDGYQLDAWGQAVQRRSVFVRLAGLRREGG
jgi:hypothetical protein